MQDTELYSALLGLRHPWRVREVKLDLAADRVDVWVVEVAGAAWECLECGNKAPLYDHAQERVWRHLNTCHCQTYLHARLPRVKCSEHGVRQVPAPWAGPGSQFTLRCESWLIDTLKECDVTGVARLTGTSWDEAWGIVERAVARGLARKVRRIPQYLGVDEKAFAKRHRYETLVCDLKGGTVEYVVEDRTQESLERYYRQFTVKELAEVKAVAMDMWDPFIAATRKHLPQAEDKIVFDQLPRDAHGNPSSGPSAPPGAQGADGSGRRATERDPAPVAGQPGERARVAAGGVPSGTRDEPQDRASLGDQGIAARVLDLRLCQECAGVLPAVVLLGHALPARPDHQGGQDPASAPAQYPDLLQALHLQRYCRRPQQQDPDGQGDGLRVS